MSGRMDSETRRISATCWPSLTNATRPSFWYAWCLPGTFNCGRRKWTSRRGTFVRISLEQVRDVAEWFALKGSSFARRISSSCLPPVHRLFLFSRTRQNWQKVCVLVNRKRTKQDVPSCYFLTLSFNDVESCCCSIRVIQ